MPPRGQTPRRPARQRPRPRRRRETMAIASLSDFGRMAELESIVEISTCRKGTEARRGMNESNRSDCIHASNMQVRRSSKQKQDLIHCWRRATCRVPPPPRAPRRLPAPRPPDKPNHRQENPISLEPRRGRPPRPRLACCRWWLGGSRWRHPEPAADRRDNRTSCSRRSRSIYTFSTSSRPPST